MAKPYRRKDSKYWWISPFIDGQQVPQSSKTTDYFEAWDKLRALEGKVADGVPITPQTGRALFSHLARDLEIDYENKELKTLKDLKRRIKKHINPAIGHLRVDQIKPSTIREYIRVRKSAGATNGGINRELAVIKRAFRLGVPEKVAVVPHVEMLPEDNQRETQFTEEQFRSVLAHANAILHDVLIVAYYTGWRIRSILNLEWRCVDLTNGFMWLDAAKTKNRKMVRCPLDSLPELKTAMENRQRITKEIEKRDGSIIPRVFHREGKPVLSIRKAWDIARVNAGVPGHVIHDFRRTAVRELNAAGVDLRTIMDLCGFKSYAMVLRYVGQSPDDRLIAAAKKRMAAKG